MTAYLQGCFSSDKKGNQCRIEHYVDGKTLTIRVSRGSYLKTVARWRGNEIAFDTFRPASQDIMMHDPDAGLSIMCRTRRDRDRYVRSFAAFIAAKPDLADLALNERVFTLDPIQKRTFDYGGNNVVTDLTLIAAHIRLPSLREAVLILECDDVIKTIDDEDFGFSLQSGELFKVKMRAQLRVESDRRPRPVTFEVEPPGYTDLAQKAYSAPILAYLRDQGVKLN